MADQDNILTKLHDLLLYVVHVLLKTERLENPDGKNSSVQLEVRLQLLCPRIIAEAGRRVNDGFVPILSKMPGFVAYYWVDSGNGVMVSTSIFESESAAKESVAKAAEWVNANIKSLIPNPPQVTAGKVVAYKVK